jgi:hypothetical protein
MSGPNASSVRFPTPHPVSKGEQVLEIRTKGTTQEQQDALLAAAESIWGNDLIIEGSLDYGGTLIVSVPSRASV